MPRTNHPAVYSRQVLDVIERIIPPRVTVLDPMAGIGWPLVNALPGRKLVMVEIEPDWENMHPDVQQGDSTDLPFKSGRFRWACTSPTYANRFADKHNAQERCRPCKGTGRIKNPIVGVCDKCGGSGRRNHTRITYKHRLGHELHPNNTGGMQWGKAYRETNEAIWRELHRVMAKGGKFVLNISNHIRKGEEVDVVGWHTETLTKLGFAVMEGITVKTDRMGYGANREKRVAHEWVIVFEKVS